MSKDPQIIGLMQDTIIPALCEDFNFESKREATKILNQLKAAVNSLELEVEKEDGENIYSFSETKINRRKK